MSSLCRTRIGHSGPKLDAKFVSVLASVEHGLCKTVTALKRDLGRRSKSALSDLSRSERFTSGE